MVVVRGQDFLAGLNGKDKCDEDGMSAGRSTRFMEYPPFRGVKLRLSLLLMMVWIAKKKGFRQKVNRIGMHLTSESLIYQRSAEYRK